MSKPPNADSSNTGILVPAFNAARHLSGVLRDVKKQVPEERIVVVNDGSSDDTEAVASSEGVHVVNHPVNRGKGAALETGFREAEKLGLLFMVCLDADGQHDTKEISAFIRRQAETGADIVVGNRMAERGDMPPLRVFANRFTSAFVSARAGTRIPDSQNGYRLLRVETLNAIHLETRRYETESEMLIKAGRRGARIESVPVRTIYGDEVSGVHPLVDTLRFFRLAFKSLFW